MRKYQIIFPVLVVLVIVLISCNDEEKSVVDITPVIPGDFSVESFRVMDIDNTGTAADVRVSFEIKSELETLDKIWLLASGEELSLSDALQVPETNRLELEIKQNVHQDLPVMLIDAEGNLLSENVPYHFYILASFLDSGFSATLSTSVALTLTNEAVVATMFIVGDFQANEDIAINADGDLFVNGGGLNSSNIYRVTPKGQSTVFATGLSHPVGIDVDSEGNLYVSNFKSTNINHIAADGTNTVLVSDTRLSGGGGIALANDGSIFNTFWSSSSLYIISNLQVATYSTRSELNGPVGMTYDKERGQLYVANFEDGKIFRINSDTTLTEIASTPITIGHLAYQGSHFYVTGWKEHIVLKVSMDGQVVETYGEGISGTLDGSAENARFYKPNGIAVTKDERYVFVSQGDGKLRKIAARRPE